MNHPKPERRHYTESLEQLKTFFPAPTSSPMIDGYSVHTISQFLDQVDGLKSAAPILGLANRRSYHEICEQGFPDQTSTVEDVVSGLVEYCQGMPVWAHPNTQVNVIPATTIPSITAGIAAALYNPNIIWDHYSSRFAEAEIQAVAMLSDLIGYDPRTSGGLFTFGGTGTILYGCKIGLEKLFGGRVLQDGLREDVKIVASEVSHYARLNVAGWLGIGMRNLVTVPATRDNEMSLPDLERCLRDAFARGEKVAAIIATLGSTDAFGIDDLGAIVRLRDQLAQEYHLDQLPQVHADAVIGWVWSVFRDYDFDSNPLGFHARTLRSLQDSLTRMGDLALADSIGIDFHKTGFAPYLSSIVLVKDRRDLALLSREPDEMPYLYQFGQYKPGSYTLECSRPAGGALAAVANMRLLGKDGFRVLVGHQVEMSQMLRERLERLRFIEVLNDFNYGPVTLIRVYPDGVDAAAAFEQELTDPGYRDRVEEHNRYNRRIQEIMQQRALRGEGVLLSWTDAYRHARYEEGPPIAALKSFIMSPWTDLDAVQTVVDQIVEAREQLNLA